MIFTGHFCFPSIFQQRFITKCCQRKSRFCSSCFPANTLSEATWKTCIYSCIGLHICSRFEVSRKCISHTGYQKTYRSICNHCGIYQNHTGALFKICIIVKSTFRCIEYRRMTGWCIRGCNGRYNNQIISFCYAFCRIDCFSSPKTYGTGTIPLLRKLLKSGYFCSRTLSAKSTFYKLNLKFFCCSF